MRKGADTADATRSGHPRMLKVVAGTLMAWAVFFFGFLSAYSNEGQEFSYTFVASAALAAVGAGGAAALIWGHRIIGIAVLVPLALFVVFAYGQTTI